MTESTPERGSAGQTFLIGETLYLRGLETGDAKHAAAWRSSVFPVPAARAEEILKEDIPKQAEQHKVRLIACRIADDVPVGSVEYQYRDWRTAWVTAWADPALRGSQGRDPSARRSLVLGRAPRGGRLDGRRRRRVGGGGGGRVAGHAGSL